MQASSCTQKKNEASIPILLNSSTYYFLLIYYHSAFTVITKIDNAMNTYTKTLIILDSYHQPQLVIGHGISNQHEAVGGVERKLGRPPTEGYLTLEGNISLVV